jgi:hypothetical protein
MGQRFRVPFDMTNRHGFINLTRLGIQIHSKENMKKYIITILVLLSMLIIQVGAVAAAPMASGTVLLVSVGHGFKGPIFTFTVSGHFSKKQLKGTVHIQGGADYGLHCAQQNDTTVTCTTSDKVSSVNVSVTFGGSTFWTYVPGAPTKQFCYNVYDYDLDYIWQSYGTHCQNAPAQYGDEIPWYNPDWDDYYNAEFLPVGPLCSGIVEDAYYYVCGT